MSGLVHPLSWRDWGVPALLWVSAQLELWVFDLQSELIRGPRLAFALLVTVAAAALALRRSRPTTALVGIVALSAAMETPWFYALLTSTMYMAVVAVFACGRYGRTRSRYLALVLPQALVVLHAVLAPEETLAESWAWGLNALWIFALGAAFRREARLREEALRAAALEAEFDATRRRLGLAREVHDVVSNSLAVVVVQAELAQLLVARDQARAIDALETIRDSARVALAETRRLLHELRDPAEAEIPAQLPMWPDLPDLVQRMRASGLPVVMDWPPQPPELSAEVSATAYRLVQEALTNVMRHGGSAPTSLLVRQEANSLVIEVQDQGALHAEPLRPGHGLTGMGERVTACGGHLTAGPSSEGGFRVRAVLPVGAPT